MGRQAFLFYYFCICYDIKNSKHVHPEMCREELFGEEGYRFTVMKKRFAENAEIKHFEQPFSWESLHVSGIICMTEKDL